ncbi:MAG: Na+/H+ antiporter subunit C [Pseudomonadota bacterium]
MASLLALVTGLLMAASVWLLLSRNLIRVLFGLVLMSNVANLVIFVSGGLTIGNPALIAEGTLAPDTNVANALPQALILTAIVIGFGLLTFALALTYRAYQALGTIDVDAMRVAEPATQVDDEM